MIAYTEKIFQPEKITPRAGFFTKEAPKEIQQIRALEKINTQARRRKEETFLQQAKLLENYEDDVPFERDIERHINIYQFFSDLELRGYFTWRTKWRKGVLQKTNTSFARLYINELINLIGCQNPHDGYTKLLAFQENYGRLDNSIIPCLTLWLRDFVVAYNLDHTLLPPIAQDARDHALWVLTTMDQHSAHDICAACMELSSYSLQKSKIFKEKQKRVEKVVTNVVKKISSYYREKYTDSWTTDYFGAMECIPIDLFQGAVFVNQPAVDFNYCINELRQYHYYFGQWELKFFNEFQNRKRKMGNLLRMIDSLFRSSYGYAPISYKNDTPWLQQIIEQEINVREPFDTSKKLSFNAKKLEHIRQNANYIQERLLTEEERFVPELAQKPTAPTLLGKNEIRYLTCLLTNQDKTWIRQENLLESILIDSINEKLFDQFNDTVLNEEGVLADYQEALANIYLR